MSVCCYTTLNSLVCRVGTKINFRENFVKIRTKIIFVFREKMREFRFYICTIQFTSLSHFSTPGWWEACLLFSMNLNLTLLSSSHWSRLPHPLSPPCRMAARIGHHWPLKCCTLVPAIPWAPSVNRVLLPILAPLLTEKPPSPCNSLFIMQW
jgi:hypothetical protein